MNTKLWTILVWIAGDNNLTDYGAKDIAELKQIGSTDVVDLVVEYDRAGTAGTRRYHLRKGTTLDADEVMDLGETDSGDPAIATDFFTWGMTTYPSRHVACVLWNHGSGIDEADIYARLRAKRGGGHGRGPGPAVDRRQVRAIASSGLRRSLFRTTVDEALEDKGIAYDDTSRDFLDNAELARVLAEVTRRTGRKVDVLGFDACLMNMLEIAYELRDHAEVLVGSEEVEPGDGWPYEKVTEAAVAAAGASPGGSPVSLARAIVTGYGESYAQARPPEDVTQAALDLRRVGALADAVDGLAAACLANLQAAEDYAVFSRTVRRAQRFQTKDFVDLGDFCRELVTRSANPEVKDAAQTVLDVLLGAGAVEPAVLANVAQGDSVARATGTAIYFPLANDVTVAYDRLSFAKRNRWAQLIQEYGRS